MRRLRNNRSPDPDELASQGFDRADLEGSAIEPVAEEIPWLRVFGADLPGSLLSEPPGAESEATADRVLRQARELIGLGRKLDALLLLRHTLEPGTHPAVPQARLLLAELLEQTGEIEAALEELGLALTEGGESFGVLLQRGALLARTSRAVEAERDLRAAIKLRPDDPEGHGQLGLCFLRRGRAADAARSFRDALRHAPDDPELLYQLGESLQAIGDTDAALAALERAAARAPRDPRPLKLMGRLLDGLGRTEQAMVMHRRARDASLP
jgi:Flp pilus assembly protein TadD